MRVVDRTTIAAALTWSDAVTAARRAFLALGADEVVQPAQFELLPTSGGEVHIKGAYLSGSPVLTFKVATGGFPGAAANGCTIVLDAATGAPRWILADEGMLTDMRTAAAGALATMSLARPDARRLLVLGTGGQAVAQIHAHRAALPNLAVRLWGRRADRAAAVAASVGAEAVTDLQAAVADSDIIVTATSSRRALVEAAWVRPGTHLSAVGSDTPGKQELAADLLSRAQPLVCDDLELASRAGELQHADDDIRARAVTLSDVLAGRRPGRTSDAQISVADLCGLGVQDAAIAELVIARLPAR